MTAARTRAAERTVRWTPALAVIVAAFIVSVPTGADAIWAWGGALGVLAVLTWVVAALRDAAALRAVLLIDLIVIFAAVGALALPAGSFGWPVTILLALAGWAALIRFLPGLRPAAPWLRPGRMTKGLLWVAAAIVVAGAAGLSLWARWADPEPPPFVANLSGHAVLLVLAGIVGFSAVNSVAEEFLYRGVLQTELTTLAGAVPAVILQAAAFGVAHVQGFPSGWTGVLMSAAWGLALGVVRLRTGGILAVYLLHILADTTIGLLGLFLLR